MQPSIPFNRPVIVGKELFYIAQAVTFGNIAGDGIFTHRCAQLLEERFGIHKVLMTPSCTAALEMAAMLCDLGPGDEVIMPSYTFVSTANAVARLGARPVFIDICRDTLNLDPDLIEAALSERTRAIMPVHYAGVGCDMGRINAIADRYGLKVIEDAAQAVNAFVGGQALGSVGHLGTYSFHETKNYTCGEGGALCINAPELVERAEIIRDKGTNRKQFFRGLVDKYTWVEVGSSYVPSEVACAFLYAQLEMMGPILERRRKVYEFYMHHLQHLARQGFLQLPHIPSGCRSNYHLFHILLRDRQTRDELLTYLKERGIFAVFHYVPLHCSPMGRNYGYRGGELPNTEELSGRLLRLPFFHDITEDDQVRVVNEVKRYLTKVETRRYPAIRKAA
jgi:dTDP-4-amino-4,6-dideoxygalactose transaminase